MPKLAKNVKIGALTRFVFAIISLWVIPSPDLTWSGPPFSGVLSIFYFIKIFDRRPPSCRNWQKLSKLAYFWFLEAPSGHLEYPNWSPVVPLDPRAHHKKSGSNSSKNKEVMTTLTNRSQEQEQQQQQQQQQLKSLYDLAASPQVKI